MEDLVLDFSVGARYAVDIAMKRRLPRTPRPVNCKGDDWDATDGAILAFSSWTPLAPSPKEYNVFSNPSYLAASQPVSKRTFEHFQSKRNHQLVDVSYSSRFDPMDLCFSFQIFARRQGIVPSCSTSARILNVYKRKYRQIFYRLRKAVVDEKMWNRDFPQYPIISNLYFNLFSDSRLGGHGKNTLRSESMNTLTDSSIHPSPFFDSDSCYAFDDEMSLRYANKYSHLYDKSSVYQSTSPSVAKPQVGLTREFQPLPSAPTHPRSLSSSYSSPIKSCLKKKPLVVGPEWLRLVKSLHACRNVDSRNRIRAQLLRVLLQDTAPAERIPKALQMVGIPRRLISSSSSSEPFNRRSLLRLDEQQCPLQLRETRKRRASRPKPIIRRVTFGGSSKKFLSSGGTEEGLDEHEIVFERPGVLKRDNPKCRVSFHWAVQQNEIIHEEDSYEKAILHVQRYRPSFSLDMTKTRLAHPATLDGDCLSRIRDSEAAFYHRQQVASLSSKTSYSESGKIKLYPQSSAANQSCSSASGFSSKAPLSPLVIQPCRDTRLSVPITHGLLKIEPNVVFLPSTADVSPDVLSPMLDATVPAESYHRHKFLFVEAPSVPLSHAEVSMGHRYLDESFAYYADTWAERVPNSNTGVLSRNSKVHWMSNESPNSSTSEEMDYERGTLLKSNLKYHTLSHSSNADTKSNPEFNQPLPIKNKPINLKRLVMSDKELSDASSTLESISRGSSQRRSSSSSSGTRRDSFEDNLSNVSYRKRRTNKKLRNMESPLTSQSSLKNSPLRVYHCSYATNTLIDPFEMARQIPQPAEKRHYLTSVDPNFVRAKYRDLAENENTGQDSLIADMVNSVAEKSQEIIQCVYDVTETVNDVKRLAVGIWRSFGF